MSLCLDTHQHFCRYRPAEFAWIDGRIAGLQRDHQPADLQSHLQWAGFDGCIAVQAHILEEETDLLLNLAARTSWVQAVVGWTDLRATDLVAHLERRQGSRHLPAFAIRCRTKPTPAPGWSMPPPTGASPLCSGMAISMNC